MAMKMLQARHVVGVGYRFRVHLDTSKVLENGQPDPKYVGEWTWGETPPPGVTDVQYRAMIETRLRALALAAAASSPPGTALASEGGDF